MDKPILTIVVPCYNEEEILPYTIMNLKTLLKEMIDEKAISKESSILFVDDGSKDKTWDLIVKEAGKNEHVRGIKLSRNVGHQHALLAGISEGKETSDCLITIDADLQDDIYVMKDFINKFREGYEVVYGVRQRRETDTFFKRTTAIGFYKLMKWMGVEIVFNHADYRLISRRAADALTRFKEVNFFLRGLVPLIGFRATKVFYDRKERIAGETKYPLKKMVSFALDGITSFSVTPIRLVLYLGLASFFLSGAFALYFLYLKLFGETELGWTSLIISIWFIGGLQLIAIGIIGEYVGKIYKEVKRRPRYIVEKDTRKESRREHLHAFIHENEKLLESN